MDVLRPRQNLAAPHGSLELLGAFDSGRLFSSVTPCVAAPKVEIVDLVQRLLHGVRAGGQVGAEVAGIDRYLAGLLVVSASKLAAQIRALEEPVNLARAVRYHETLVIEVATVGLVEIAG